MFAKAYSTHENIETHVQCSSNFSPVERKIVVWTAVDIGG
jgi:hypothetical protein